MIEVGPFAPNRDVRVTSAVLPIADMRQACLLYAMSLALMQ
jgi:hypothetical protein